MPLYEYQCGKCGTFEVIQKFADPTLSACPTCGAEVEKLLSAPAIQFKGSGWYITDYARKGGNGGGKSDKSDQSGEKSGKGAEKTAGDSSSTSSSKDSSPSPSPTTGSSGGGSTPGA